MRDVTFDLLPKDQGSTLNGLELILKEHSFSYASIYQFQYILCKGGGISESVFNFASSSRKRTRSQYLNVSIYCEIFRVSDLVQFFED